MNNKDKLTTKISEVIDLVKLVGEIVKDYNERDYISIDAVEIIAKIQDGLEVILEQAHISDAIVDTFATFLSIKGKEIKGNDNVSDN